MKNKILLIPFLLILFLFGAGSVFSQSDSDTDKEKITKNEGRENSLEKGKWALQFTIDQNFTLSTFEGSIASVKKQFSSTRALRIGLALDFSHSKDETNRFTKIDTAKPQFSKSFGYSVFVYPTYMFYMNPKDAVILYAGTGITAGGSYYWTESRQDAEVAPSYYYLYDRRYSYGGGLTGTIGVEFFPIKNLSIIAEYFASFQYSHSVSKTIRDYPGDYTNIESTGDEYEFFGRRVNFGLSVYF